MLASCHIAAVFIDEEATNLRGFRCSDLSAVVAFLYMEYYHISGSLHYKGVVFGVFSGLH